MFLGDEAYLGLSAYPGVGAFHSTRQRQLPGRLPGSGRLPGILRYYTDHIERSILSSLILLCAFMCTGVLCSEVKFLCTEHNEQTPPSECTSQ